MNARHYIVRSLSHHRFAYLGVLAGAFLGATVLLGALFAGDSVKASLRRIAENRIGRATHLLSAGDRFFRQALADDLVRDGGLQAAPLLYARGIATHATSQASANQIQLVGVTEKFWELAPTPTKISLTGTQVAVNTTLARRLQVAVGDTLVVRLQKPGTLGGDAPVAGAETKLESVRCAVTAIVDDASFGRFTLEATQVATPSVFLPIAVMQQAVERAGKANVLLIAASGSSVDLPSRLRPALKLADYELGIKWLDTAPSFEITSDRIFIDPEVAAGVLQTVPGAQPVLSYLVNELRAGERATPYSIAAGTTGALAPFLPADLGSKEIVLNTWLAEDLQARAGDEVKLTYFQAGAAGALVEQSAVFRVRTIIPLTGLAADKAWMPNFPGMTNSKDQSDWDPGLPLKLDRIRDKDEKYWDDYRGAPKAFLSIEGARSLWSTRWGNATALRINQPHERESALVSTVLAGLQPEMNQLLLRDLRSGAVASANSPVDFGGLFIGMSFFLIIAALGLVAMLFQFVLLQRNREDALLSAVGLSARKLLRWRLTEGGVIVLLGGIGGILVATLYTRGILRFLESIWSRHAAGPTFTFNASATSIGLGLTIFFLCSLGALWLSIRKLTRRTLSIRLAAQAEDTAPLPKIRRRSALLATMALVAAVMAIAASQRGLPAQIAFYLAGFSLLVAGLAVCRWWMARSSTAPLASLDATQLGRLNLKARRSRSLTVVGLIATAVFMVLSVASFRKQVGSDWLKPESGTGGYAFWIETTAAQNVARDGKASGFEIFERHSAELSEIVPLRAGVGDNANCFNLNTTSQPQLLAVDVAKFAARHAFRVKAPQGWSTLAAPDSDGSVPALVDETTLLWALKRKVGDVLEYPDENGRTFRVRIAGTIIDSIFQGYVVIDEKALLARFPSHAGYSRFLVDARNSPSLEALRTRIETSARDVGGRVELTRDVLAAFHEIENTYIAIFNVLGSLGVILGSLGLAIVVARNLRERRGEFAVMTAIGIPRRVLARVVFAEFGLLVAWGISMGTLASAIAVWPNLSGLPASGAVILVGALLLGIVVLNLVSGWVIFRWSMRDLRPSVVQAA